MRGLPFQSLDKSLYCLLSCRIAPTGLSPGERAGASREEKHDKDTTLKFFPLKAHKTASSCAQSLQSLDERGYKREGRAARDQHSERRRAAGTREMWGVGGGGWLELNNCPLKVIVSTMCPTHREGAWIQGRTLPEQPHLKRSSCSVFHLPAPLGRKALRITQGKPLGSSLTPLFLVHHHFASEKFG